MTSEATDWVDNSNGTYSQRALTNGSLRISVFVRNGKYRCRCAPFFAGFELSAITLSDAKEEAQLVLAGALESVVNDLNRQDQKLSSE